MIFIKSKVTLKFVKSGIGIMNLTATIEDTGLKQLVISPLVNITELLRFLHCLSVS